MSSAKSKAARRNGAKSKGPVTELGRANSSQNAVRHGLLSNKLFVLQNESPDRWHALLTTCLERFQPADEYERELVLEIAGARWRMRRLWAIETGLMDLEMDRQAERLERDFASFDEITRQCLAFQALADDSRTLTMLSRYESRIRRCGERALAELERLQEARRARETSETMPPAAEESEAEPVPACAGPVDPMPAPAKPEPRNTPVLLRSENSKQKRGADHGRRTPPAQSDAGGSF